MARVTRIDLGSVNCYLIRAEAGFFMIDTGPPEKRPVVETALARAGCRPGGLRLIVVTHGDHDHAGNAVYLRDTFEARVAMHRDGAAQWELGDWRVGFRPRPDKVSRIFREVSRLVDTGDFETFESDIHLEDGQSLREYGLDATILSLTREGRSSLGIVAVMDPATGDDSTDKAGVPGPSLFIHDMNVAKENLETLRAVGVRTVYPGHGRPFLLERLRAPAATDREHPAG